MTPSSFAASRRLWFFDDDNLEVFVKLLDGTSINGKYWVWMSGGGSSYYAKRAILRKWRDAYLWIIHPGSHPWDFAIHRRLS